MNELTHFDNQGGHCLPPQIPMSNTVGLSQSAYSLSSYSTGTPGFLYHPPTLNIDTQTTFPQFKIGQFIFTIP